MNEWGKYLFSKPGSVASGFEEPSGEHVVFLVQPCTCIFGNSQN